MTGSFGTKHSASVGSALDQPSSFCLKAFTATTSTSTELASSRSTAQSIVTSRLREQSHGKIPQWWSLLRMCRSVSMPCFGKARCALLLAVTTLRARCFDSVSISLLGRCCQRRKRGGLNRATRRNLGLRLPWLFDNGSLPEGLRQLSTCVKEDGNDGAHAGTLTTKDAEDLLDFTTVLLERLYTEPERLRLAVERRLQRRNSDT